MGLFLNTEKSRFNRPGPVRMFLPAWLLGAPRLTSREGDARADGASAIALGAAIVPGGATIALGAGAVAAYGTITGLVIGSAAIGNNLYNIATNGYAAVTASDSTAQGAAVNAVKQASANFTSDAITAF
jgi:hypothetical protein